MAAKGGTRSWDSKKKSQCQKGWKQPKSPPAGDGHSPGARRTRGGRAALTGGEAPAHATTRANPDIAWRGRSQTRTIRHRASPRAGRTWNRQIRGARERGSGPRGWRAGRGRERPAGTSWARRSFGAMGRFGKQCRWLQSVADVLDGAELHTQRRSQWQNLHLHVYIFLPRF